MSGTSVLDLWDGNERVGTVDGLARGRVQWVRSSARGEVRAATVQSGHLGTGTAARRRLTLARAGQGSPRVTLRPAPRSTGLYHPLVSTRFAARGSRSRRRTPAGQQLHPPKFLSRCQPTRSLEARREARGEAILFVVVTMALAHRAGGDEFARRLGSSSGCPAGCGSPSASPRRFSSGDSSSVRRWETTSATIAGYRGSSPWSYSARRVPENIEDEGRGGSHPDYPQTRPGVPEVNGTAPRTRARS